MSQADVLGVPPEVRVEVVREDPSTKEGFLWVRRLVLRNHYADGTTSEPYPYFLVERSLLDAVAVVLFRRTRTEPEIVLRSQLRPPLAFRHEYDVPLPAMGTGAVQWEVPAGLMERGERGEAGICFRAAEEAHEEVGYRLDPKRFHMLGHATSLSPGMVAEKIHFVCAEILDSDVADHAHGDGHAVEEGSVSHFVPLSEAIRAVHSGLIHDVKTEVAIHRLAHWLVGG